MKTQLDYTCCHAGLEECLALEGFRTCPDSCAFYMTHHDSMANLMKANRRLRSLPETQQEHISRKYYGGTRPWTTAARRC